MAVFITTTEGDIEGGRFLALAIDSGTWSVMADVIGFDAPIVVEDFASEVAAQAGLQAVVDELASEGDVFQDAIFQDVTVLGTLRTALGGERIEIGTEESNRAQFFTGNLDEVAPGRIEVVDDDSEDGTCTVFIESPDFGAGPARLSMVVEAGSGATTIRLDAGTLSLVAADGLVVDAATYLDIVPSAPTFFPGKVAIYAREVSGVNRLCYKRPDDTEVAL